jgi:undecaprenyl-diphosphatase
VPTIGSACAYDIYKNFHQLNFNDIEIILIGIISSFISSLLVIKWLIKYVATHDLKFFAYYRILIGSLILFFFI